MSGESHFFYIPPLISLCFIKRCISCTYHESPASFDAGDSWQIFDIQRFTGYMVLLYRADRGLSTKKKRLRFLVTS